MYIEMNTEQALKLLGKKGTVLVAIHDLEQEDEVISFVKKTKAECAEVVKNAKTITRFCDDIINGLNCYSYKQPDIRNIIPVGKVKTILIRD